MEMLFISSECVHDPDVLIDSSIPFESNIIKIFQEPKVQDTIGPKPDLYRPQLSPGAEEGRISRSVISCEEQQNENRLYG